MTFRGGPVGRRLLLECRIMRPFRGKDEAILKAEGLAHLLA
jgi:hypothetical protein